MLVKDPGLGKTGTVLMTLDLLKMIGSRFFPALVLGPKRVADVVWTGERDKWDAFQDLSMIQITGHKVTKRDSLTGQRVLVHDPKLDQLRRPKADIYIANYEIVPWLTEMFPAEKWPFKIVVADECSRLKGHRLNKGGVRAEALSTIARFTGRWWNLTGTPIPNGYQDLWGQMWFVDFGQRLKRSYTAFSDAFLMEDRYTRKISMQNGAEAAIQALVADCLMSFRAEDYLDITKEQVIPVEFELDANTMAKYKSMEKDYFLEIDEAQIEAGTAMVKSMKLLQITAGSVFDENKIPHPVHDGRLEALESVLEQIAPEPLLVSYWFTFDAPRIMKWCEARGISARVYKGPKDEADWNARKFRVLLLQEQSAFGLNLHEPCRDIFHYTYTWNAELWEQMIGRVGAVRQAQAGKKKVARVWYAQAKGTIEAGVIDSNMRKISAQDALKLARARRLYDKV